MRPCATCACSTAHLGYRSGNDGNGPVNRTLSLSSLSFLFIVNLHVLTSSEKATAARLSFTYFMLEPHSGTRAGNLESKLRFDYDSCKKATVTM
jgi:hypothetical protein